MNGIHDMGGLQCFGKVDVEKDEPVFHHQWERRVFGIVQSFRGNIDAGRHSIERLDPVTYLKDGYYGRWLAAVIRNLIGFGVVTHEQLEARTNESRPLARATSGRSSWLPSAVNY